MKNQIPKISALVFLIIALFVVPAGAQSFHSFRVNIPFSFTVGQTTFSSGEYLVERLFQTTNSGILLSNLESKESLMRLTRPVSTATPKADTTLIFHRYGEQYFLSQIWIGGSETGIELPKSRAEREVEVAISPDRQKSSAPEIVSIVASARQK